MQQTYQCMLCGYQNGYRGVLQHVARIHIGREYLPWVCSCEWVFRTYIEVRQHLDRSNNSHAITAQSVPLEERPPYSRIIHRLPRKRRHEEVSEEKAATNDAQLMTYNLEQAAIPTNHFRQVENVSDEEGQEPVHLVPQIVNVPFARSTELYVSLFEEKKTYWSWTILMTSRVLLY